MNRIIAINYADETYRRKQRLNSWSAKHIGKANEVIQYSINDISVEFVYKHKHTFSFKRGAGLWIWKPYILNNTLQKIENGDYLIYTDSGTVYLKKISALVTQLEASQQDIMLFEVPLIEYQWTKKMVFEEMEALQKSYRNSLQVMSGFILIKKTVESCQFIREWLYWCEKENLLTPKKKDDFEDPLYFAHREDQSILSILAKKKGLHFFKDPTDFGRFPTQYLYRDALFYCKTYQYPYNVNSSFFLLTRKTGTIKYLLLYGLKILLSILGLRKIKSFN